MGKHGGTKGQRLRLLLGMWLLSRPVHSRSSSYPSEGRESFLHLLLLTSLQLKVFLMSKWHIWGQHIPIPLTTNGIQTVPWQDHVRTLAMDYGISEEWSRSGVPESSDADSLPKSRCRERMTDTRQADRRVFICVCQIPKPAPLPGQQVGVEFKVEKAKEDRQFYSLRSVFGVHACFQEQSVNCHWSVNSTVEESGSALFMCSSGPRHWRAH